MYESQFGFRQRPFSTAPLAPAYFASESMEPARLQISRCIERAEGVAVVVGSAGTGKSLLLEVLAEQFHDEFHVVLLTGAALGTRRALLQSILFALNLSYRGLEEGELRLSLIDHLQPSRECPQGMLLLVDEAQALPYRLLEEFRLLTNLVREGKPRVRLVLAGSPALEERLASPKVESLSQRIAVRAYLQGFSRTETVGFVTNEVDRCGGLCDSIFTADALQAVHTATAGIPRLVNQVCDHALTWAASHRRSTVDASTVQDAWADLQQLPAPWSEPTTSSAAIEFGDLDEEPADEVVVETFEPREAEGLPASADLQIAQQGRQPAAVEPPAATAQELFGQDFIDEEVVLDRYAALDASVIRCCPQVTTTEGQSFAREVAAALPELSRPLLKIAELPSEPAEALKAMPEAGPLAAHLHVARRRTHEKGPVTKREHFDPSLDPVYPELEIAPSLTSAGIIAIDKPHEGPNRMHGPATVPARFGNLFSNLRGKKK